MRFGLEKRLFSNPPPPPPHFKFSIFSFVLRVIMGGKEPEKSRFVSIKNAFALKILK